MENLFGFHCTAGYPEQSPMAPSLQTTDLHDDGFSPHHMVPLNWTSACGPEQFASSGFSSSAAISDAPSSSAAEVQRAEAGLEEEEEVSKQLRAKIACHPLYPQLLEAYIDCQKVGAPPEIAKLLDEIGRENGDLCQRSACLGADPELDEFMVSFLENSQFFRVQQFQTLILTETYRDLLVKYKSDLSKPFDEATAFLNNMEAQLNSICSGSYRNYSPDEDTGSSEEDLNREKEENESKRINEDRELKDKLLRRYSGYISGLKHEFSKKKKKEKLPKEARQILLAWWNVHFKWPYPTEADKVALAEWTGLDQKQINNWFINQRKRHWKPTEEMQAAVLDGLYGPFSTSD